MKIFIKRLLTVVGRLSILFVIYQFLRVVFFFYNKHHFPEVDFSDMIRMMHGGLQFDLTGLLYLNLLYIVLYLLPFKFTENKLYRKLLFWLFMITNGLGLAFDIGDIFYFNYVLKRSTVEIFMFAGEKNIGLLAWQFVKDFWWGFSVFIILMYLIYKWYKLFKDPVLDGRYQIKTYISGIAILLLTLYFSIVGIRGGFTRDTRPINMNNAGAYINKPLEMAIVLNTPFTIIRTLNKQAFKPVHYFSEDEVTQIFNPIKDFKADTTMSKKNVVIIIIESFAKEYTGLLNKDIKGYKGYTPFLDSLMQQSHTFANAYANGRKSIDAMPSVLTSIPSLVQPYVISPYGTNKLYGLGKILKQRGYKTAFFHGAPNGSMGFDAFTHLAGFDEYYGMNEYGNKADFDGYWGVPDDKFLQYMAKTLDTFKQPFASTVFTLSSHHPFKLPPDFKGKFKGGPLPIHKVVQYMDYSMKHFFETASKMPWFKNTIFVITADHCNQSYLPEYNSTVGRHAIPIIFYEPSNQNSIALDSTLTQQADIMPRILRRLNYSGKILSFGNDPKTEKHPFVVNYNNGTWDYMQDQWLLQYRDDKSIGLYNYLKDRTLKHNLINQPPIDISPMVKRLKAFIQQYKNRLIENRLTPEN
jgi:phosphoglycerol transferase MdoB-like AlkP superfamily enzyme